MKKEDIQSVSWKSDTKLLLSAKREYYEMNTEFSEFIRNGTEEEKQEVFGRVIDKACEKQRTIITGVGINILSHDGMVNIDSDQITYANIRGMYKTGNGSGIQFSDEMSKERRQKIQSLCDSIAKQLYELEDELSR